MDYLQSRRFLDTLPDWERGERPDGPLSDFLPRMRALLACLDDPQRAYRSVIVGGTNGKGTTGRLLTALLDAHGLKTGFFSSPHLHSIRERVRVGGEPVDREIWAEGVTRLFERTLDFDAAGFGRYTKFEALAALAALTFGNEGVQIGVFEVGLGGTYDATNAWDSELAVLTSVQLDHTDILGRTLRDIARDKVRIARSGKPLVTPREHDPEVWDVLNGAREEAGFEIVVCETRDPDGPLAKAVDAREDVTEPLRRNAALAAAACRRLLGDAFDEEIAASVLQEISWPARFEIAGRDPMTVIDGAHNPAGAAALAEELSRRAARWRFVVGVGEGHDAAGILANLAPVASEFVFTRSEHPKALDAKALADLAPPEIPVRTLSGDREELQNELVSRDPKDVVCVTGSLHLAARARDILDLPRERDGIHEDVLLESLHCLTEAASLKGLRFEEATGDGNVLRLAAPDGPVYFLRNRHPFNDYVSARLAEDKGYQYKLFLNAGVPTPRTLTVFNPLADERFHRYRTHPSVDAAVRDVEARFSYPVVVKRSHGSMAQAVYLADDRESLHTRLQALCETSGLLNNVMVVQEYVPGPEYRAVASFGDVLLGYEKQGTIREEREGHAVHDLNPLHQDDGRAVRVEDANLLEEMSDVAESIHRILRLGFYAIDAILGPKGLTVLEINPNPICYFYNSSNGRTDFVSIYSRLIDRFILGDSTACGGRTVSFPDRA